MKNNKIRLRSHMTALVLVLFILTVLTACSNGTPEEVGITFPTEMLNSENTQLSTGAESVKPTISAEMESADTNPTNQPASMDTYDKTAENPSDIQPSDAQNAADTQTPIPSEISDKIPAVMVKGELYYSTGKESEEDKDSEGIAFPAFADIQNDTQSRSEINSGEDTRQSHSEMMPTAIEGVTMEVTDLKGSTLTVTITNNTDKEIEAGDDYRLEYFDETDQSWEELDIIIDNAAFNSIAYIVPKDKSRELEIDYSWFYGELAPGRYRVAKTIVDFRATGDYDQYTYRAEFTIN